MRVLRGRNVCELFYEGMHLLDEAGAREDSRNGPVLVVPYPVMSVYENPCERVLLDSKRDANPFFHLMEGLWMLAGRDDTAYLDRYVRDFGARYGDSGVVHGAYGRRWRSALGFDQLDEVVRRLRANPRDRQCVIQMWDATPSDYVMNPHSSGHEEWGQDDLRGDWRDRPCNTQIYLRIRRGTREESSPVVHPTKTGRFVEDVECNVLDVTITCRSNDMIWGGYGANAVHFSMLQEYLAGRIGVGVGTLYQLSNNYHAYLDMIERIGPPEGLDAHDPYATGEVRAVPMGEDWSKWDADLAAFMRWHDWLWAQTSEFTDISVGVANQSTNQWFLTVPVRATQSRWLWKHDRKSEARLTAEEIAAPDWRRACVEWMSRRAR